MTTASPKNLGPILQDVVHYCLAVMRNPPKESAFSVGRDGSRDYLTHCAFSRASEIRYALHGCMPAGAYLETATIGALFKAAVACASANGLDWYTGERPEPTEAPAAPIRPLASLKVGDALNASEVAAYWNGRPGWAEGVYAYDGVHKDGSCGWKVVETRESKPSWSF